MASPDPIRTRRSPGLPARSRTQAGAAAFIAAPPERVAELLETLVTLGQARQMADGRFVE